jgi:hypothetical protein
VENVEVENIKGTPGNEFQLVSPPGLMVDQTTYRHIIGGNSPTCMYLSGVNTTDTTVYGQSGCNSTSYGIYLAPGTAISVYDMEFSGSATLFYVDNSSMGLTCTNCYSESFKTFLTANGVSNKTGPPHIAFYSSGFNSNSSGVIGTYTQNGTLSFHNSGLNSSSNGASFMFNPIGTRGHGYTGLLITDGMKWGNITLNNAGATSGTGQMISNDTFGGEVGGNSWYSRAALITGASPSIYDGRPMGYINSPITEADGVSSNVFSHYPSFSGGKAEYGWFLNQALEGGWNQAGSPAQGEWDAGVVNATSEYKLGGRTVLPTTLTGFHGTSGTKVQLSDGTGTKGNIAIFASDGSITNGPSAALPVTGGTVTGATMFDQGIDVHSGYGLVNGDVGGGITVGSDAGVNVINGSKITFAKFTSGGLSLGTDYAKTTPPTNGAIIQGNVGVGTSSPSALLSVGRGSPFQVDGNGVVHQNGHVPSASIGTIIGTNAAGYVSGIAGATSLTINFANSGWTTWVSCVANSSVPATQPYVKSISKTGVTFGFLPLRGTLYYHCDGN